MRVGGFVGKRCPGLPRGYLASIKEADFRGDDKAKHAHDLILWNMLRSS
jgi:hypothetical protein